MFSQSDKEQINKQGINLSIMEEQLAGFRQGFPFINLKKPAVINDGILKLSPTDEQKYIQLYDEYSKMHEVLKFVPASGAATRMFKDLYAYLESDDTTNLSAQVSEVFQHIQQFVFYDKLSEILKKNGYEITTLEPKRLAEFILTEKGLNYGALPKALLLFHKYPDKSRTSLEEHFVEGALYSKSADNKVTLHFTVSPEHKSGFEAIVSKYIRQYEDYYHVKFDISYSTQLPSTDTIAVDLNNEPFRDKNGRLVFRPGGHGALINNLNAMNSDLIFIKNIDNVVPDRLKHETVKYKKVIAGLLVYLQSELYRYQQMWNEGKMNEAGIATLKQFFKTCFHVEIKNTEDVGKILFRPIRVCGMVKNEGEPGGGPYWINDAEYGESLQIIESSQINLNDEKQKSIFNQATHFNPVDLVCSVKNFNGEKYDLFNFIDKNTCFISQKSKDGKPLKALELPGLWNGAMANWNTIFVDVPIITFNPVKIINDLLRPQHS
jgi:hypothetical protein